MTETTAVKPAATLDPTLDQGHPRKWWILVAVSTAVERVTNAVDALADRVATALGCSGVLAKT